jgi:hypothetical protein
MRPGQSPYSKRQSQGFLEVFDVVVALPQIARALQ